MKPKLIILLLVAFNSIFLTVIGQTLPDSLGFTNKAEAKNQMVNGLREGKWVEYMFLDVDYYGVTDDTNKAEYYCLIVYKDDKPIGLERDYYMNGKILREIHFIAGKENGVEKEYYVSGKPKGETPYTNDSINGVAKEYYENRKLKNETE